MRTGTGRNIVSPLGGLGGGISWWLPAYSLLELRMMEEVETTGPVGLANLQANSHHQQTNTQTFTCQMPFLTPNQQYQSTK